MANETSNDDLRRRVLVSRQSALVDKLPPPHIPRVKQQVIPMIPNFIDEIDPFQLNLTRLMKKVI